MFRAHQKVFQKYFETSCRKKGWFDEENEQSGLKYDKSRCKIVLMISYTIFLHDWNEILYFSVAWILLDIWQKNWK